MMKKLQYALKKAGIKSIEDLFQRTNEIINKERVVLKTDITDKILASAFKGKGVIKFRDTEIYQMNTEIALNLLFNQQRYYAEEKYGIKYIKLKEAIKYTYTENTKMDQIIKYNKFVGSTSLTEILYKEEKELVSYIKSCTKCKIVQKIDFYNFKKTNIK